MAFMLVVPVLYVQQIQLLLQILKDAHAHHQIGFTYSHPIHVHA